MSSVRVDKVSAQLREELSSVITRRLRDPRLGLISVVDVDLSPDLRNARVKVSSLSDEGQSRAEVDALNHARGFIRHELAQRLRNLRRIPELVFVSDRNIEYAVHIGQVLEEILPQAGGEGDAEGESR